MSICSSCGKGTLPNVVKSSPFLIVKERLTENEKEKEEIFVMQGVNRGGYPDYYAPYYLNRELGMVGLQLPIMNLSCLYLHEPPKGGRTKDGREKAQACTDFSVKELVDFAKDMKIILMMGAETIRTFTGYNASDVYGMVCKSELLPNVPIIIPCPNVDKIMAQPIGEMRLALKKFSEEIKFYKEYMKNDSTIVPSSDNPY